MLPHGSAAPSPQMADIFSIITAFRQNENENKEVEKFGNIIQKETLSVSSCDFHAKLTKPSNKRRLQAA